ncbi:MAG TPA: DUF6496 domain-containing protein [Methylomirabilota bacterium]
MAKKRTTPRTGRRPAKGRGKVSKVMREYKHRTLRSGSGGKVRKRKQAVAIALSEARRSGARIPRRRRSRAR